MKFDKLLLILCVAAYPVFAVEPTKEEKLTMTGNTLDETLFFCTTRIEAKSADGTKTSVGTGFIVSKQFDDKKEAIFVVTCRHVVEGFDKATISFVADKDGRPQLGVKRSVEIGELSKSVFFNSDAKIDVAIFQFVPVYLHMTAIGEKPFFRAFSNAFVPTSDTNLSAIQSIIFIGYPNGIRDEVNLLPIARRGVTATPYFVDYNGLPLFLIDANVFPGSSGSPVLVFDEGAFPGKKGTTEMKVGTRAHLLGLVSQAYLKEDEGEVQFKAIPSAVLPTYKMRSFLNLGVVVKASAIFETIEQFLKANPPKSATEAEPAIPPK